MAINISVDNFINIKKLVRNEFIEKRLIRPQKLLDAFVDCNAVYIDGKPQQVYLNDTEALLGVIKANGYNVSSIEDLDYFTKQSKEPISRDEIVSNYSDTKRIESKSFNGLMVSVFDKLRVNINGQQQYIYPIEGTGLFIHYISKLELDNDIVLVGVENPQVVWYISKYKYLFEENKKYIFLSLSEYKTSYQYKWLESFKGEYIHFGDFDLAGINIYLNTIVPRLKNCKKYSFLMPDNIYTIIREKNYKKDFLNQIRYLNLESQNNTQLQKLIDFIKDNKITLEQESLKLN